MKPAKRDLEKARKLLDKLERFALEPVHSATISSDGVCCSKSNISIIAKAIADRTEECAKVVENYYWSEAERRGTDDPRTNIATAIRKVGGE